MNEASEIRRREFVIVHVVQCFTLHSSLLLHRRMTARLASAPFWSSEFSSRLAAGPRLNAIPNELPFCAGFAGATPEALKKLQSREYQRWSFSQCSGPRRAQLRFIKKAIAAPTTATSTAISTTFAIVMFSTSKRGPIREAMRKLKSQVLHK